MKKLNHILNKHFQISCPILHAVGGSVVVKPLGRVAFQSILKMLGIFG